MAFFKKKSKTKVSSGDTTEEAVALSTEDLRSTNEGLTRNIEFLSWIQEFSKKVVVITFFIFIVVELFSIVMVLLEYRVSYDITYIDTLMTEINESFRQVIGGYLIKAATENVVKIGGGYLESYMTSKTTVIEQTMVSAAASINDPEEPTGSKYFGEDEEE